MYINFSVLKNGQIILGTICIICNCKEEVLTPNICGKPKAVKRADGPLKGP